MVSSDEVLKVNWNWFNLENCLPPVSCYDLKLTSTVLCTELWQYLKMIFNLRTTTIFLCLFFTPVFSRSLNFEPCPPRQCFTGPTYVFTNLTGPAYVGWLQDHPWAGVHSPPRIFNPNQLDKPPFIPEERGPANQPQESANQARTLFIFLKNPTILTTVPSKPNVNSVFNPQVGLGGLTDQGTLFKNLDEEITDEETRRW